MINSSKRNILVACLVLGPLLQLLGDFLWSIGGFEYSWSIWREASYIFFVPTGLLLAKFLEGKSFKFSVFASALHLVGCIGAAAIMPLYRLGGFYEIGGPYEFPKIVQSVLSEKLFGATLFPVGLCFPLSFLMFGVGFIRNRLNKWIGCQLIAAGIFFWMGNALEMKFFLIFGDLWLLLTHCAIAYAYYKGKVDEEHARNTMRQKSL